MEQAKLTIQMHLPIIHVFLESGEFSKFFLKNVQLHQTLTLPVFLYQKASAEGSVYRPGRRTGTQRAEKTHAN
jgi:hypothetical protein